jgi:hypothetical protein
MLNQVAGFAMTLPHHCADSPDQQISPAAPLHHAEHESVAVGDNHSKTPAKAPACNNCFAFCLMSAATCGAAAIIDLHNDIFIFNLAYIWQSATTPRLRDRIPDLELPPPRFG